MFKKLKKESVLSIFVLLLFSILLIESSRGQDVIDDDNNNNNKNKNNSTSENETYYFGKTEYTFSNIENYKIEILEYSNQTCSKISSGPRSIFENSILGIGDTKEIIVCEVKFACYKNSGNCLYFKSPYNTYKIEKHIQRGLTFINEDKPSEKLILHSCYENDEICFSEQKCQINSDCLSNRCDSGRCIKKEDDSLYVCQISYTDAYEFKIECRLDINEPCNDNQDCVTNYCNQYKRICLDKNVTYKFTATGQYLFIFIGFVMLMLLSLVMYLYYIRDKLVNRTLTHRHLSESSSTNNTNRNQNGDNESENSDVVFNNIYYHN